MTYIAFFFDLAIGGLSASLVPLADPLHLCFMDSWLTGFLREQAIFLLRLLVKYLKKSITELYPTLLLALN